MKNKFKIIALLLFSIFLVAGCSQNNSKDSQAISEKNKMQITTTFFPMYDFTKEVVGKYGQVSMIMPGNVEPHDYEPSSKDMAKISNSSLFIYNSPEMEHWVTSAKKATGKNTTFVEAAQDIPLTKSDDHSDPHIWLDPVLAKQEVINIKEAIIKKDPAHKDYYEKRTKAYLAQLDGLNKQYQEMAKNAKHKTFITQHEAFSYLAKQYGLTQKSLTGLNDDAEPSAKNLAAIQTYMQENDIHYIFVENGLSPKIAKTIQAETKAQLLPLNPIEQVSSKEIKAGVTYISIMEQNLQNLQKGLS